MKVSRGELKQYSAPISENGDVKSQNNVVNDCDIFLKNAENAVLLTDVLVYGKQHMNTLENLL